MKANLIKRTACLAILGAALAGANGTARAQVSTNLFTFDASATGTWASWQSEYSGYWDNTQDHTGNGGGSLYWYQDISKANGVQIFNTWAGNPYTAGSYIDFTAATNISFWVKWDTTYSTIGIDDFNSQAYASPAGWGDHGIVVGIQPQSPGGQGTAVGNAYIPEAASNGWALVNVPITPGGVANENQTVGMSLFKWSNTTNNQPGIFAFWIDDIQAEYPGAPPPPPTLQNLAPAGPPGLNIYDDGNSGDRQSVETVVSAQNYGWVTNPAPVTYSVNIAQAPSTNFSGGQVHIMILPGTGITELAPDWNETNAVVLFIERQTNGAVVGSLRYKLNDASDNKNLFGSNTNVFGGSGLGWTNTIVAGYGGLLCSVTNAGGYTGTWSVTLGVGGNSDNITLTGPSGSVNGQFPTGDSTNFTGPVTVYWGVQPNNSGWFQRTVLSSASISGSLDTMSADLTQPLNVNQLAKSASAPLLVFTTPANAVYWLQWAPPDPNFVLQSAADILGPWMNVVQTTPPPTNFLNTFGTSNFISNARNYNPPPIAISYDYGQDAALTVDWVAGPTYDAGTNAGSGSVKLSWTWNGANGSEGVTMDLFPSGQAMPGGTLSFDIMIDPSSTAGTNGDYGYFQVAARDQSYNWNAVLGQTLLATAGGASNQWAHVSIPLGTGAASNIRGLTFESDNNATISGPETIYIDNVQFTGSPTGPPTVYNIHSTNCTFITTSMLPSAGAGYFRMQKP